MTAAVEFTAKSRPGVRLWERPAENAIVKSTGSLPTNEAPKISPGKRRVEDAVDANQELLREIRTGIELRVSAIRARLSHGQFLGGTFDSSQRVSSPLYFRQLQSTGGSGSRHRSPGRMKFTLDSFTKIDGIVVPSHPLESEDSAHFRSRIRTDCLGDCCCILGPEIAIPRWTDFD